VQTGLSTSAIVGVMPVRRGGPAHRGGPVRADVRLLTQGLNAPGPARVRRGGRGARTLGRWDVSERLEREFPLSVGNPDQVVLWLNWSARYFPYIERELARAGLAGVRARAPGAAAGARSESHRGSFSTDRGMLRQGAGVPGGPPPTHVSGEVPRIRHRRVPLPKARARGGTPTEPVEPG
jgi:hypothetical protein